MIVRGYIAAGKDMIQINNVLNGPQRVFIPVTGGFIKGVGPAEGLEPEIHPSSSDGILVRRICMLPNASRQQMWIGPGANRFPRVFRR